MSAFMDIRRCGSKALWHKKAREIRGFFLDQNLNF